MRNLVLCLFLTSSTAAMANAGNIGGTNLIAQPIDFSSLEPKAVAPKLMVPRFSGPKMQLPVPKLPKVPLRIKLGRPF